MLLYGDGNLTESLLRLCSLSVWVRRSGGLRSVHNASIASTSEFGPLEGSWGPPTVVAMVARGTQGECAQLQGACATDERLS